ncbi:unnamed protein product [Notodromas monacha]|uniref:Uncharacterized protein n=1 Tax=Notodromas monacha TaxID=399045 RepID=A0A7R9BQZ0_9CRUS|nr:unnamed protein product [Notodromas monacha]CAG0918710.1 unnamed protein product [Notodromas monacha]
MDADSAFVRLNNRLVRSLPINAVQDPDTISHTPVFHDTWSRQELNLTMIQCRGSTKFGEDILQIEQFNVVPVRWTSENLTLFLVLTSSSLIVYAEQSRNFKDAYISIAEINGDFDVRAAVPDNALITFAAKVNDQSTEISFYNQDVFALDERFATSPVLQAFDVFPSAFGTKLVSVERNYQPNIRIPLVQVVHVMRDTEGYRKAAEIQIYLRELPDTHNLRHLVDAKGFSITNDVTYLVIAVDGTSISIHQLLGSSGAEELLNVHAKDIVKLLPVLKIGSTVYLGASTSKNDILVFSSRNLGKSRPDDSQVCQVGYASGESLLQSFNSEASSGTVIAQREAISSAQTPLEKFAELAKLGVALWLEKSADPGVFNKVLDLCEKNAPDIPVRVVTEMSALAPEKLQRMRDVVSHLRQLSSSGYKITVVRPSLPRPEHVGDSGEKWKLAEALLPQGIGAGQIHFFISIRQLGAPRHRFTVYW